MGERNREEEDAGELAEEVVMSISKSWGEEGECDSVSAGERGRVMEGEAGEEARNVLDIGG